MSAITATPVPSFVAPRIPRWPSETPLFVLIAICSAAIWGLLLLSIIGALYAALIAAFFFFSHLVFITHIRGSGVRLGPEQFPELWQRVVELSRRAGMERPPETYVVQAGGSLNAFATKLFRGRLVVLFAELLEACEGDDAARDMVIGHELGHLRLGHLDWFTLTAPGRLIPFLGSAYSRACEFSCDRWGASLCGDRDGATRGLAILAAGGKLGAQVNMKAFVAQRRDLDTGWMAIGTWLATYPPLSARIEALDATLGRDVPHSTKGQTHGAFILVTIMVLPGLLAAAGMAAWMAMITSLTERASEVSAERTPTQIVEGTPEEIAARVQGDLGEIAAVLREHHARSGAVLGDLDELPTIWSDYREGDAPLLDPFDGYAYGYAADGKHIVLFSSGPDAEAETGDDITVEADL